MGMTTPAVCSALLLAVALAASGGENPAPIKLNAAWRYHLGQPEGDPAAVNYAVIRHGRWCHFHIPMRCLPPTLQVSPRTGGISAGIGVSFRRHRNGLAGRCFLEFRGVMQDTALWVNGAKVGEYAVSGYDSFDFDITSKMKAGRNVIAVMVDDRRNPQIPPDGQEADYLLFGGLYRDVFLHVTDQTHLTFPWEAKQAVNGSVPTFYTFAGLSHRLVRRWAARRL